MNQINFSTLSTSKTLAYLIEVRIRNLLFKLAQQSKDFYGQKKHLVMTSGIIAAGTGLDLGVVRYSVHYKYVKEVKGNSGGRWLEEPKQADVFIEVGFANTGARLAGNTAITLNTGQVLERSSMPISIDGLSSTLRFPEYLKVLTVLESLPLLYSPTLVMAEGDEVNYVDNLTPTPYTPPASENGN